jgi:hypothetical protein
MRTTPQIKYTAEVEDATTTRQGQFCKECHGKTLLYELKEEDVKKWMDALLEKPLQRVLSKSVEVSTERIVKADVDSKKALRCDVWVKVKNETGGLINVFGIEIDSGKHQYKYKSEDEKEKTRLDLVCLQKEAYTSGAAYGLLRISQVGDVGKGEVGPGLLTRWFIMREWIVAAVRNPQSFPNNGKGWLVYLNYDAENKHINKGLVPYAVTTKAPRLPEGKKQADWTVSMDPTFLVEFQGLDFSGKRVVIPGAFNPVSE